MEKGKKRKRDADYPRIAYHTSTRTFDRLFKEETLSEMKEVVRKKLGLDPNTPMSFAQMREGNTVDLEDDDDFDAFYSLARSTNFVDVRVIIGSVETEPATSITAAPVTPTKKKTKKRKNKTSSEFLLETDGGQVADDERDVREPSSAAAVTEQSKVSFDTADSHKPSKKKRKANMGNSVLGDDISSRVSENASDISMQPTISLVTSNAGDAQLPGGNLASTSRHMSPPPADQPGAKTKKTKKKVKQREQLASEPPDTGPLITESVPSTVKQTTNKSKTKGAPDAPIVHFAEQLSAMISDASAINGLAAEKATETHERPQEKKRKSKKRRPQSHEKSESNLLNSLIEVPKAAGEMSVIEINGNKVAAHGEDETPITRQEKSLPKRRKSTSDELKAAQATMDAAVLRILAAKRAALAAAASVESPAQEEEGVISAQNPRQRKKRKSLTASKFDHPEAGADSEQRQTVSGGVKLSEDASPSEPPSISGGSGADSTCPLCLLSPLHGREKCPLVLGGPKSLEMRLSELQSASATTVKNQRDVIVELQQLLTTAKNDGGKDTGSPLSGYASQRCSQVARGSRLDVRTSRPGSISVLTSREKLRPSMKTKTSMGKHEGSDASSDDAPEDESVVSSIPKEVSLLDINLDNLIRGPSIPVLRAADIPSPESSDEEPDQVLEEDEDPAPPHSRKTGVSDSSDDADSGLEEDSPVVGEYQDPPATNDPKLDLLPSLGTDHIFFQDLGQCGESQNTDTSADAALGAALAVETAVFKLADRSQDLASSSQPPRTASEVETTSPQVTQALSSTTTFVDTPPTATAAIPTEQSPSPRLVLPLLAKLPDTTRENEKAEDARPAGIVHQTRTRSAKHLNNSQTPQAPEVSHTPVIRFAQPSQEVPDGAVRRTRSSNRRETLGTTTPTAVPVRFGRQSRLIRASNPSQSIEDPNSVAASSSNSQDAMSLDTWATLKASSPESAVMVDELDPSSPAHFITSMDAANPKVNGASKDAPAKNPLFLLTESQPPFPYSQWKDASQQEAGNEPISNESDEEHEVEASVQRSQPKPSQALKYRRLTEISGDHGLFSTPTSLRPARFSPASSQQATDMYGRLEHEEIESESDSESDDSEQEQSHIPKSRRAGVKRK